MSIWNRSLALFLALSTLAAGLFIAFAHPVAPVLVGAGFVSVVALVSWRPRSGLFVLPALLPVLNFSPWTGWLIVDEFDVLVLAVLAAGYFRLWRDRVALENGRVLALALVLVVLLVVRGAFGLTVEDLDWFAGYFSPLNGLRVGKSLLWGTLLFPLIVQADRIDSVNIDVRGFFSACLLGALFVVLAVLWERSFYPGLSDISTPYRTVALFWEMHVGGAALDAFLVLVAPLCIWAWRSTDSVIGRVILGAFVLAFVYVCLTTFSRGVVGAAGGSLVLLVTLLMLRRFVGTFRKHALRLASLFILLLVAVETFVLLGAGSFMDKRLAASESDFGGRLQHWERGIGLLSAQNEWLFGLGLGRLPARSTQGESALPLSGRFFLSEEGEENEEDGHMVLSGPSGLYKRHLGGLFALSQRVDYVAGQRYRFSMDVRAEQSVRMMVQVCALHLLYPSRCQYRRILVLPGEWRRFEAVLAGAPFKDRSWLNGGHGVLLVSVLTPGASVDLGALGLSAGGGDLLRNPRFLASGAGWFPVAHTYFLPWHIDNLYLEILIETGLFGLAGFLMLVLMVVRRLFVAYVQGSIYAPYFLASIAGLMALGLVVSVVDMPRVATLFGLFMLWAWQCSCPESDKAAIRQYN